MLCLCFFSCNDCGHDCSHDHWDNIPLSLCSSCTHAPQAVNRIGAGLSLCWGACHPFPLSPFVFSLSAHLLYFHQTAAFSPSASVCDMLSRSLDPWTLSLFLVFWLVIWSGLSCHIRTRDENTLFLSYLPSPPIWSCLTSSFDTHQCLLDASTAPGRRLVVWLHVGVACSSLLEFALQVSPGPCPFHSTIFTISSTVCMGRV